MTKISALIFNREYFIYRLQYTIFALFQNKCCLEAFALAQDHLY